MGLDLFFRVDKKVNNFRTTLLSIINDKQIAKIVLSYPYYSENKINDNGVVSNYSILDSGIRETVLSWHNYRIVTIGAFKLDKHGNEDSWTQSYRNFVNKLRKDISGNNIDYKAYFLNGNTNLSHAKFCIGYKIINEGYIPVIAMIGSSNLTNKTFEFYPDFNYETDVVIWDDSNYEFKLNENNEEDLGYIPTKPKNNYDIKRNLEYLDKKVANLIEEGCTPVELS